MLRQGCLATGTSTLADPMSATRQSSERADEGT